VSHILDLIDKTVSDYETSADAMRWKPDDPFQNSAVTTVCITIGDIGPWEDVKIYAIIYDESHRIPRQLDSLTPRSVN
jgi:hypothetical protein